MNELRRGIELKHGDKTAGSSEELRVAVTFPRPDGKPGPTNYPGPLTLENVKEFIPKKQTMKDGIKELKNLGFELTEEGRLTVSMKCKKRIFEKAFSTTLVKFQLDTKQNYARDHVFFPPKGAGFKLPPNLNGLIDNVYIQWPHIYMGKKLSARPPVVSYYHLEVPNDVAYLLNVKPLHDRGIWGKGMNEDIRVVMIDSGFDHKSHPFFKSHNYTSTVVCAGEAKNPAEDFLGHGTGQSANFFSVARLAKFIGVKIGTDRDDLMDIHPASMLEGFQKASRLNPDIISFSGGNDLRYEESQQQRLSLPNSLKALEAEILHMVASGIIVIAAAGNGQFQFPAMMPDVIAAGGVYVDRDGSMQASDQASAYYSKIYPGRHVPDVCGLVGMKDDKYIMLPIPLTSDLLMKVYKIIKLGDSGDNKSETKTNDGWEAFSGTSAAAPQIAGVCALLKAQNPDLTPSLIKAILQRTAKDVLIGNSNPESSNDGTPQKAERGYDGATGAGLVDAYSAWQMVTKLMGKMTNRR
jgi:hypothetical protein